MVLSILIQHFVFDILLSIFCSFGSVISRSCGGVRFLAERDALVPGCIVGFGRGGGW